MRLADQLNNEVATVPTVYGIETQQMSLQRHEYRKLQQYLPFTVLKRWNLH